MLEEWKNLTPTGTRKTTSPVSQTAVRNKAGFIDAEKSAGKSLNEPGCPDNLLEELWQQEGYRTSDVTDGEKSKPGSPKNLPSEIGAFLAACSAFESCPDERFFYQSYQHIEALNRFRYALAQNVNHICLLTGESGSGKTYLAKLFLEELWQNRNMHSAYVVARNQGSAEPLLRDIISQISFIPAQFLGGDQEQLEEMLKAFLQRTMTMGKEKLVVILDELENPESAEMISLRSIAHSRGKQIIPVLLIVIGRCQIESALAERPQIQSRIGLRFRLNHFSRADTEAYIMHRLAAGKETITLNKEIYDVIHSTTAGNPRRIDLLCKLLIDYRKVHHLHQLTVNHVLFIAADLESPGIQVNLEDESAAAGPGLR